MTRKLGRIERWAAISLVVAGTAAMAGCGSSSNSGVAVSPAISGVVTQSPVTGAVVFADHLTGTTADLKPGSDEIAAAVATGTDGVFTLPSTPTYAYRIVSQGGVTADGLDAIQMIAPAGAANITPLTTLVALDTTGKMKTLIESLGVNFDTDISKSVTPAALLLAKNVEATVSAMSGLLNSGSAPVTSDVMNAVQQVVVQKIVDNLQNKTKDQVMDNAALATTLQTAVAGALQDSAVTGVVTVTDATAVAQNLLPSSVISAIFTAVGSTSTSKSDAVAESTLIDQSKVDSIASAVSSALDTTKSSGAVTVTPPSNHAPTITGAPATTGIAGKGYSFTPTASDSDGNTLTFCISQKPAWASFNPSTGALTGTPKDAGVYQGIVISVTDGSASAALESFTITVSVSSGAGTNPSGASPSSGIGGGL